MNLPLQAPPVSRQASTHHYTAGHIAGSGIACTICRAACDQLGGIAKQLCLAACDRTVC